MLRRNFLTVGSFGGISLAHMLWSNKMFADQKHYDFIKPKAQSVIHIYLPGGIAHQEFLDPKPYAPIEYRGDGQVIKTKNSDIISSFFPELASIADKYTIIRSMTHGESAHERGTHNMFTGYKPSPALQYPSFGSVVSHEYGSRNDLPAYVCIPNKPNEFAGTGYLSSSFSPFSLGADPASDNFEVQDLSLPQGVDLDRFERRKAALAQVNQDFFYKNPHADKMKAMNSFYDQAFSLITSEKARAAFDLKAENEKMKERYGKNQAGQRMLMARRLVEAGVRMVTLTYGGWDMHQGINAGMKSQAPPLDKALTALINDLDERGLLDTTLVMVSSEFGRTPKINTDAGRDHWPKAFSTMLAGGGVKRGLVYGSTDSTASEPEDHAVSPEDFAYTMYHLLGIVADKELMAPGDRPVEIVDNGKVLKDILA